MIDQKKKMNLLITLGLLIAVSAPAFGRIFNHCEMARELYYNHNFPRHEIDDWVCLIEFESSFNTAANAGPNTDGSFDWGLFQVNDRYWCGVGYPGKECNVDCYSMYDSVN